MKRLIEKSPDRRDAFIQVLLSGCAMRRARGQGTATWLLVGMLLLGSTAQPAEAGLWDEVKEWYASFQLGEVDEASIPKAPVEYVGEVGLNYLSSIELDFGENTPGIGRIKEMNFSPEGTLLITDYVGKQALEFNRTDGQYIRSFGRQGQGPGEYGSPRSMVVAPQGQVYLLDGVFGQILRYDRQGQFLNGTTYYRGVSLLVGRAGEIFLAKMNQMKIQEVQRLDRETWAVLFRTPISTDDQRFISFRMGGFSHLCYSPARHRLYYLGPNDYLVKELDADTGQIVRQFGQRPDGFIPLPERYHGLLRGSLADMRELEMTEVKNMTLIKDRYLWISHVIDTQDWLTKWMLYDLAASSRIAAYGFNDTALELLATFPNDIPWKSVAAWQDCVYVWKSPRQR